MHINDHDEAFVPKLYLLGLSVPLICARLPCVVQHVILPLSGTRPSIARMRVPCAARHTAQNAASAY